MKSERLEKRRKSISKEITERVNKHFNDMETIENNKLIAEFMGEEIGFADTSEPCIMGQVHAWTPVKYHKSWDWLMPVVEKIQSINDCVYCVTIDQNLCNIWSEDSSYNKESLSYSTIEATYKSVVDFINWYNSQAK